ncbi:hypothetical protein [Acetobacter nitrogenifigens]|uniref:Uncharacterized protein n=1 Tax=Acetobacter nitrogenifigens DSM 23921 = NBRC 105050 TaxID=1120919 RepID=A0A511X651_9PROT|nr:hypothetical protein [Acetobacter nitrogenifigens]GEN58427.1 hypothetical protein ANI02nite_03110 [Acetobacter nitrogenifigens DSM 23921 = NBRC 105050]
MNFKNTVQISSLKHLMQFLPMAVCVLVLVPAALADEIPKDWQVYGNARFHYQICYPASLLKPQGEPDNGDGQSFFGDNGVELSVFGRNHVDGLTLADNAKMESTQLAGSSGKTTYQAVRKDWAVVSGNDGKDGVFYSKILDSGDHYVVFELKYTQKESAVYDKVIVQLSRCLKSDQKT